MNFLSLQQTALVVPSLEQKKRKKRKKKKKKNGSFKNHQTYQKKITKMIEE